MPHATAELTIDELAREAGMTVRNIRAHQSRGLLPAPEVRSRTGYYGPEHLARLRLIQEMQADGFNLAAIKRLLARSDGAAEEVLGFARALLAPFEDEEPELVTLDELTERYGEGNAKVLARAERLGLIVPLGEDRYEIPSPTILRAGEEVVALGVPLEKAMDIIDSVSRHSQAVTDRFVRLFLERVWKPFERAGQPEEQWPEVRESLERLRPLATETLVAVFHLRMTESVERAFGRELERRSKG